MSILQTRSHKNSLDSSPVGSVALKLINGLNNTFLNHNASKLHTHKQSETAHSQSEEPQKPSKHSLKCDLTKSMTKMSVSRLPLTTTTNANPESFVSRSGWLSSEKRKFQLPVIQT